MKFSTKILVECLLKFNHIHALLSGSSYYGLKSSGVCMHLKMSNQANKSKRLE